jgi:hypothetical protein
LRCTFNAALLREDADRLEVRTPGGELVFFAKLPEEPKVTVRDWPLFGILPWADPDLQNETLGSSGSESTQGPTQKISKDAGSGGGTPPKGSSPESGEEGSSPGGEKPGVAPEESEPVRGPHEPPPQEKPPVCEQYGCQP